MRVAIGIAWLVAVTMAGCTAAEATTHQSPNFIFVLVDDLGWNGFGFNGHNKEVQTPYIDSLARGGVVLDNHYTCRWGGTCIVGRWSICMASHRRRRCCIDSGSTAAAAAVVVASCCTRLDCCGSTAASA